MPNVVTPFSRKRHAVANQPNPHPRHRREGYFDDKDHWHDSSETPEPAANHSS
jgi:hypothetical protein